MYYENKDEAIQYLKGTRVSEIVGTADDRIFIGSTKSGGLFEYKREDNSFVQLSDKLCRKYCMTSPAMFFVYEAMQT